MTRLQLLGVAVLSVLSTVGVLVGAVGASPDLGALGDLTRQVRVAAGAPVAEEEPAEAEAASEDAATEEDVPVEEAPAAAATAEEPTGDVDVDVGEFDDTAGTEGSDTPTAAADDAPKPSRIKHIFVITLAGFGFDATFGSGSAAPYLARELRPKGTLLTGFSSLGRADLPDRLALISGQPPNTATQGNCATYQEIPASTKPNSAGEVTVDGCVFPNTVTTLADQVTSAGQTWRGYAQDMEKGPKGPVLCRRPPSNGPDDTQQPRPGDTYAARNNPFVYFHSLLDLSDCDANAGPLTKLEGDLASAKKTPNLSYIAPGLCSDGSVAACPDGTPGGLPAADAFLKAWVPKILASPAYKDAGLLVITFAGGAGTPAGGDGPVRNGTLLISRYAKPGGTDETELGPYALLRTFEDLLGYKALARAKEARSLSSTVLATARVIEPGDD